MSDSNSVTPDIALDLKKNTSVLPSPGEVLRLNREDSGLSLADVAVALNITVGKVKHLESDEFQKMHSEPFTRGYLRSYAKLLKIDAESLIRCYEEFIGSMSEDSSGDTVGLGAPAGAGSGLSVGKLLPVVFLLVASAWFVMEGLNSSESIGDSETPIVEALDNKSIELSDDASIGAESSPAAAVLAADSLADSAVGVEENDVAEAVEIVVESATVVERSLDKLDFTFTDESWVEVTDSGNDVLFADVKQAGELLSLEGVAPFSVMLGNARATSVTLNGKKVASVPPSGRDTLKFTVSSD